MLPDHRTTWPDVLAGRSSQVNATTTLLLNQSGSRKLVGPETLIVQDLCGWEGHDANLWRQLDPQVFGLDGFSKADAQTTLPTAKVPANVKNFELPREAYNRI